MANNFHGPADAFLYLDGYQGILWDITNLEWGQDVETAEVSGLGYDFRKYAPTGISKASVSFEGSILDDTALDSWEALNQLSTAPDATDRLFSMGLAKTSIGSDCVEFQGAVQGRFGVITSLDDLQRIAATFEITGAQNNGLVLLDLTTLSSDQNTQSTSVDGGSSSDNGLVGQLHVNAFDGDTGDQLLVTIQESSDDSTYADIITFTCTSSTSPFADRQETTGGVEQYLAVSAAFTDSGLGSADVFVMAARK